MTAKLPARSPKSKSNSQSKATPGQTVYVDEIHLHVHDLDALKELNESDPDLARQVVDQKDAIDRREHGSYRFGMLLTSIVCVVGIIYAADLIKNSGMISGAIFVLLILSLALLGRVIITGNWSKTSWVGKILDGIVRILGGTPTDLEK